MFEISKVNTHHQVSQTKGSESRVFNPFLLLVCPCILQSDLTISCNSRKCNGMITFLVSITHWVILGLGTFQLFKNLSVLFISQIVPFLFLFSNCSVPVSYRSVPLLVFLVKERSIPFHPILDVLSRNTVPFTFCSYSRFPFLVKKVSIPRSLKRGVWYLQIQKKIN